MGILIRSARVSKSRKVLRLLLATVFLVVMSVAVYKAQEYYNQAREFEKSGISYYEDGYFREAVKEFQNARDLHYSSPELLSLQANSYFYSKKYGQAETIYAEIIKRDKKNVWAKNQLAILYLKTRKFDKAIKLLQESLQVDPEFTGSLILLGRAYEQSEKLSEAYKNYDFAERQQNNHILTGIAKKAKQRVSFKRGFHTSSTWLQGSKMPRLKDSESVFPVVKMSAFKGSGRGGGDKPKIAILSLSTEPVYIRLNKGDKPKVAGLPIEARNGMNLIDLGIPQFYESVNDFPIAPIEYKTIKVRISKSRPAIAQVWPKPLMTVNDPGSLQLKLIGLTLMPEDLSSAKFDLFNVRGMKKIQGKVNFSLDRGLVYFKPRKSLPGGRYIAYFDPQIKNIAGKPLLKSKTWLFTVN